MRLDAYYYSFDATGEIAVDRVLSAVACAGKAFHSTAPWADEEIESPTRYAEHLRGATCNEWIQNAAADAAAEIAALRADVERLTRERATLSEAYTACELALHDAMPEGATYQHFIDGVRIVVAHVKALSRERDEARRERDEARAQVTSWQRAQLMAVNTVHEREAEIARWRDGASADLAAIEELRGKLDHANTALAEQCGLAMHAQLDVVEIGRILACPDGASLLEHAGEVVKALREACEVVDGTALRHVSDVAAKVETWRALLPAVRR